MNLQQRLDDTRAEEYDAGTFEQWLEEALSDNTEIIRDNKKHEWYNVACAFDIETSSFIDHNGEKAATMYLWGFCCNGLCLYGRTWEAWQSLTDQLA